MSIPHHHAEWLSLLETSGPFLSLPVLLEAFPQGLEKPDSDFRAELRAAFPEWQTQNADPAIHTAWLQFVRRGLGWPDSYWHENQAISPALRLDVAAHGETVRPAGVLADGTSGEARPRVLWMQYEPGQKLESPLKNRAWNASPVSRMSELLAAIDVPLGLLTNGQSWVLVHRTRDGASSTATFDAQLWLEEPLTWAAFTSLLGARRLFAVAEGWTLESLFAKSLDNQQEVTDRLGFQVRRALERLVATFERENQNTAGELLREQSPREIYGAALGVMMRLVFLFCAEERELLPLSNEFWARNYAVSTLRAQLREEADAWGEEILERQFDAWCRLLATFRAVWGGVNNDVCELAAYGGQLFDPNCHEFLEGRPAGSDWQNVRADPLPVDNRTVLHLLEALQILQVQVPGMGVQARMVSFASLDIEQIGHVYEGLLDHTVARAQTPMLSLKGAKDIEPEVELQKLEALAGEPKKLLDFLAKLTGRAKPTLQKELASGALDQIGPLNRVCGDPNLAERVLPFAPLLRRDSFDLPIVIRAGALFVTGGNDRRSSGTHYTPRALTEPLVQTTLTPLLYRDFQNGAAASRQTLKSPREILDLKICDPACGSAGVLVQVTRFLAEKLVESWEIAEAKAREKSADEAEQTPLLFLPYAETHTLDANAATLPDEAPERLLEARRLVADRCIYGVDRDPLAIEMAQLSLWLVTMAKNRPFSFLEHALRVGDSLAGLDLHQLRTQSIARVENAGGAGRATFALAVNQARTARELIHTLGDDERAKRAALHESQRLVERLKTLGDAILAPSFSSLKPAARLTKTTNNLARWRTSEWNQDDNAALQNAISADLGDIQPFHWPLEFPDAFFRDSHASEHEQSGQIQNGGFDALVGNPPFVGGQRITGILGVPYRNYLIESLARGKTGSADLVAYFYLRAFDLLRNGGAFGLIATNTIAQGDTREVGLDQIAAQATIFAANPSQKWPGTASLEVAIVHVWKGPWRAPIQLAGRTVSGITPYLSEPGQVGGNPHRLAANAGKSFQGSIVLGMGFVLTPEAAADLIARNPANAEVLQPYLNGEDLNSRPDASPSRWVINFRDWPLNRETAPEGYEGKVAADFPDCLKIIEELVKPERDKLAKGDASARDGARRWWQFLRPRNELYSTIQELEKVMVKALVSPTWAFGAVPNDIVFDQKLVVLCDVPLWKLQNSIHQVWAAQYGSTLGKTTYNYTPTDCFETFPFPQLTPELSRELDELGGAYHAHRRGICASRELGLTKVYNLFHEPQTRLDVPFSRALAPFDDIRELRVLHQKMDELVARAYGWNDLDLGHDFHPTTQGTRFTLSPAARSEVLDRLLALNHARYALEVAQGLHEKKKSGKKSAQLGLGW